MSNPTTPFGWQMPQNTDLVTDLPADFEVFGQAVATSMQDLLGGTTGQVLAKASNTDMDFVWSADAAGMTNPMTTTGDSIYSSSGSTPARLPIGSAGQVLTVASGVPSWATPSSGGMTLLTTMTLSGGSTTSATFSSAYKQLVMYLQNVTTNTGAQANVRFNGDTGSNYAYRRYDTTSSATLGSGSATKLILFNTTAHTGKNAGHSIMTLMRPSDTDTVFVQVNTLENNAAQFWTAAGVYDNSAAITDVTFIADGATFSTGTVYIYGVN